MLTLLPVLLLNPFVFGSGLLGLLLTVLGLWFFRLPLTPTAGAQEMQGMDDKGDAPTTTTADRVFSPSELLAFDGRDPSLPILLSVRGTGGATYLSEPDGETQSGNSL